jgi:hypothetical protein
MPLVRLNWRVACSTARVRVCGVQSCRYRSRIDSVVPGTTRNPMKGIVVGCDRSRRDQYSLSTGPAQFTITKTATVTEANRDKAVDLV